MPVINLDSLTTSQGVSINGATSSNSGWSVSSAGDVNGDGFADILVGAIYSSIISSLEGPGTLYVIYGGEYIQSTIDLDDLGDLGFTVTGVANGDWCGYSVSGAGDVNNDTYADIIIGAPMANTSYVIFGSTTLNNINLANGLNSSQGFSINSAYSVQSVSGAGDVNGDGYDDIIIGIPYSRIDAGESYVIYGGATLTNIDLAKLTSSQGFSVYGNVSNGLSGYSVSGAGDVNGDGYDDVIIGAPDANSDVGEAYVIYGGTSLADINIETLNSDQGFTMFGGEYGFAGWSVSGAGDVNGDGYDDIIIGAPGTTAGGSFNSGTVYIIFGNLTNMLTTISLNNIATGQGITIFSSPGDGEYENGYYVSNAGDVNNDGYDDVILGGPIANSKAGISYVIYGNSSNNFSNIIYLDDMNGFSLMGASAGDESGLSVSSAGDINGDGFDDVIIGAPYKNDYDGASYIIYGALSGFTTPTPTAMPTPQSENIEWWNSVEFKLASSIGVPILSFAAAWFLREKIAFYILDNWGHEFKLYNQYISLKENEVAIKLSDNKLLAITKFQEYVILDNDNDSKGISKLLHKTIIQALDDPHVFQSFTLIQSEKNQIRDYLITHKYMAPTRIGCFLKSYTELGYFKGAIYNFFLYQFEVEHNRACEKQVRYNDDVTVTSVDKLSSSSDIDGSDHHSTVNPIISTPSPQKVIKSERQSYVEDVEDPDRYSTVLEVSRQDTRSFNAKNDGVAKKGCVLMSIDAMMDPEHVKLQDKAFLEFGANLNHAGEEFVSSHSKLLAIEDSISSSNNIDYSSAALFTQQTLEYAPTIRYFFKLIGIELPQVYLPNEAWVGVHFAAGVIKTGGDSFLSLGQTVESGAYYARLVLYDMLAETNTEEQPTDLISFFQACSKHIAVGGALGLASGNPVYGAINGAAMCLNQHQMLEESTEQTAVRYTVDAVAGIAAVYGLSDQNVLAQAIGVVSAVSMIDIATRVGMTTTELGVNGVSSSFEAGDYEYV